MGLLWTQRFFAPLLYPAEEKIAHRPINLARNLAKCCTSNPCRKERCRGLGVLSMFRDLQVEALGASLVDGYVAPMWRVTLMRVSAEGSLRYQGPASRTVAESHIPTSALPNQPKGGVYHR